MSVIWTSRTRTTQPTQQQVARTGLAVGLSLLWTPTAGRNLVNNQRPDTDNTSRIASPYGIAAQCSTGQTNVEWNTEQIKTSDGAGQGDFTIACLAMASTYLYTQEHLVFQKNDAAGSPYAQAGLMIHNNGSGTPQANSFCFFQYDGSAAPTPYISGGVVPGTWQLFGGIRRGATGIVKVGTVSGSASGTKVDFSNGSRRFAIGSRGNGTTESFTGKVALTAVWDRALTDAEWASFVANPWQLFAPEKRPVFIGSAGGGANTTATLSNTLDAATLTGVGNVTRSGTLAVTLDAATLTGVGAVTTSGTLSSTLEDATLAGVGSVAVGTNRDGALAVTLDAATLAGIGAVTTSGTLAVTLDAATLAGIGTAGQPRTGTLAVTLDNVTLSGIGAIPAAPSTGGGKTTGKNLSRKQKKKLKAVESQEWLKAEETARQLLSDRFTKQTPQEKAQALETYIESLQPVIEALKALTSQIEEVVEEAPVIELTPHQEVIQRFDRLEKKVKSVEELIIILMADL